MQYIVETREDHGGRTPGDLSLPDGFAERSRWDSEEMRTTLWNLVNREMRMRRVLNGGRLNKTVGRHDWFESAVGRKDGWKDFVERWGLGVDWFWDPYDRSF